MAARQITGIHPQKHNPDRLNVELDGEYGFGLSRIVAAWLKVGDFLSEERINTLLQTESHEVAYQKAIHLLDYRPRTEKEIRVKLLQKGFETEEINAVIQRLQEVNLIQDQQFARMWIDNRNDFHPRSQRLMRYELRNKGVSEQMIDTALAESVSDQELAARAAAGYARRLNSLDQKEFRKRLSAFLARRGFSYETVAPVVRSFLTAFEQSQSINPENEDDENGKY